MKTKKISINPGDFDFLASGRSDGLGARLINLLNAKRLGRKNNLPVKFFSPPLPRQHKYNADFSDIFSEQHREIIYCISHNDVGAEIRNQNGKYKIISEHFLLVEEDENENNARNSFRETLECVVFNKNITEGIKIIDEHAGLNNAGSVALHVRMGDIVDNIVKWFDVKLLPIELYDIMMERLIEESRNNIILIASNDENYKIQFKQKTKSCLGLEDIIDTSHLSGLEKDLLEIYAMSRCSIIYGPSESAFSICAHLIGKGAFVSVGEYLLGNRILAAMSELINKVSAQEKYSLASTLLKQGHIEQANKLYYEAIAIRPDYWEAYIRLAESLCKQQDIQKAVSLLKQGTKVLPHNARINHLLRTICKENDLGPQGNRMKPPLDKRATPLSP